ncbi:HAMP domain-containing protein [Natronospirillum operosum]|uniref:histidine kinase n=1 Tax=Natronospirillum operosum TaxID=2759953 RepID=A0A4Z0W9L6_9GAMM|nr:ATP-binding protein [Natronospirillum operosum]TGG90665.1 HAMP domain-containing protein [Natronospirillum operosum]
MNRLFTRIYLTLLCTLIALGGLAWVFLDVVNKNRFETWAEEQTVWVAELIQSGWARQAADRRADWTGLVSSLTTVEWSTHPGPGRALLVDSQWRQQRVDLDVPLDQSSRLRGTLTDWTQWRVGGGYLLLNELSRVPAGERSGHLDRLSSGLPFPVEAIEVSSAPELGVLGRRQLSQGQAFVSTRSDGLGTAREAVYVPMGEGFALRLGPFDSFNWLPASGLSALVVSGLVALGLVVLIVLTPLRQRLQRITRAVDAISAQQGRHTRVPTGPEDELGRMAVHINQMADRLVLSAQRNRELNQAVSHDLKTPLARLRFAMALLPSAVRSSDAVQDMTQALEELETLTAELLLFHRLDATHSRSVDWHLLRPQDCLQRVLHSLPSGPEITVDCQPERELHLPVSAAGLRRLLGNLVGNASQYGCTRVAIEDWLAEDGLWEIRISDDGPGIPAEDRQRVLEPFVRLDHARNLNQQGHGLGLAICHAVAQRVGGALILDTGPLGGLTVALRLPAHEGDSGSASLQNGNKTNTLSDYT